MKTGILVLISWVAGGILNTINTSKINKIGRNPSDPMFPNSPKLAVAIPDSTEKWGPEFVGKASLPVRQRIPVPREIFYGPITTHAISVQSHFVHKDVARDICSRCSTCIHKSECSYSLALPVI